MSDLRRLKEVLDNQAKKRVKSGDWKKLSYVERVPDNAKLITLDVEHLEVGFVFTMKGKLVGAYNYKD